MMINNILLQYCICNVMCDFFEALSKCGWKELDLSLLLLNVSGLHPHLRILSSELHQGFIECECSCVNGFSFSLDHWIRVLLNIL